MTGGGCVPIYPVGQLNRKSGLADQGIVPAHEHNTVNRFQAMKRILYELLGPSAGLVTSEAGAHRKALGPWLTLYLMT